MNVKTAVGWTIGIAFAGLVTGYFNGMGGWAWRASERAMLAIKGMSPITTGSVIQLDRDAEEEATRER